MAGMYESLPGDFYDESLSKANPLTRHYHASRYAKIRRFIGGSFKEGMKVLDIGSGSSSWNTAGFPVTGVDINKGMLDYGRKMGYMVRGLVSDIENAPLPVQDGSYDFAVLSEVLEHMADPLRLLKEANRALRDGGMVVVTVPLDTPFSPWAVFFELGCILRGDIMGDPYFKKRCGHIQHFSVAAMSRLLAEAGFVVVGKDVTAFNIGLMARKRPGGL